MGCTFRVPAGTELLLTKKILKLKYLWKSTNFTCNSLKETETFFLGDFEDARLLRLIMKKKSQGILFSRNNFVSQGVISLLFFGNLSRCCRQSGEGSMENKKDQENHIKEFGSRNAPEASQKNSGRPRGHPGRLGRFMWKFQFKGQNVRRTDGTYDGTDGTYDGTYDGTHTRGCPVKIICVYWVFSFPRALKTPTSLN